jgi:threonylcarbamoyladenosine tRNA methylthiotransferase MtaB
MSTPRTVAFHTLGCKLNFSETSTISQQFKEHGFAVNDFTEGADIFVLNTCSVTEFADRKCKKIVREALSYNDQAKIVIVGCYAQLKPKEISEIDGVDMVLGAKEKFNLIHHIEELSNSSEKGIIKAGEIKEVNSFIQAFSHDDRTRTFLKIQDGCDYKCTFCTIPLARGKSRSDTVENILKNVCEIAATGKKEIVLTGVNIGDFGNGTEVIEGKRSKKQALFIDLIKQLDELDVGIERYRISSIEPNLCTDEIIEFVAESNRFLAHFHLPLQSGCDKILALMKRRYKRSLYKKRVSRIKKIMPHACIGVDVIVGFPGETEDDFMETYQFLMDLDISYLHVFTYSERPNTPAAEMTSTIDMSIRKQRNKMLRILSEKKKRAFYQQYVGSERVVLIEQAKDRKKLSGYTDNYIRVELPFQNAILNTQQILKLENIMDSGLMAATNISNRL